MLPCPVLCCPCNVLLPCATPVLLLHYCCACCCSYDVMNDFMSAGIHRLWKDEFVRMVGPIVSGDGEWPVDRVLLPLRL